MSGGNSARTSAEPTPLPPAPELRAGSIPPDGPILDETWSRSRRSPDDEMTDVLRLEYDTAGGLLRDQSDRTRLRNVRERAPDSPHPYSFLGHPSRQWSIHAERERRESSRPGSGDESRRREIATYASLFDPFDPNMPISQSPDYRAWLRSTPDYRDRQRQERETTAPLQSNGAVSDLPPLRRMSRRNITDGPLLSGLREAGVPADSERSPPETASSAGNADADSWDTMFANIVPDTNLPSVDSSFTSAAATASFSASNSNNSRAHSADSNSASSFGTNVTVPDAPMETAELAVEDWTCDTDSDDATPREPPESRRAWRARRSIFASSSHLDREWQYPRPSQRIVWNVSDDERQHMRRVYEHGDRAERRDGLASQLRRSGVDSELVDLFVNENRSDSEHATLLRRFLRLRHTMDDELFFMVLAEISREAAAHGRATIAQQRGLSPPPIPAVPNMARDGHIFGYTPAALDNNDTTMDSSDSEGRLSHRSGSSSEDEAANVLSSLAGRHDFPESYWANVGLRRTALRYAREEQAERSNGATASSSRPDISRRAEAAEALRGVWDDASSILQRFRDRTERLEGSGSGSSTPPARSSADVRRMLDEIEERRRRNDEFRGDPIERIRRLREELDRMGEFVDGLSGSGGSGQQRDSHL